MGAVAPGLTSAAPAVLDGVTASIAPVRTSASGAEGSGVTSSATDTGAVAAEIDFFDPYCVGHIDTPNTAPATAILAIAAAGHHDMPLLVLPSDWRFATLYPAWLRMLGFWIAMFSLLFIGRTLRVNCFKVTNTATVTKGGKAKATTDSVEEYSDLNNKACENDQP